MVGDVGGVNGGALGQHAGIDQLIQHADGQRGDVLGAQVIHNQQVGFLAGGQPLVAAVVVEVLAAQPGSQRGGTGVQHVMAALQHGVSNGQRQVGLAQAAAAHKQQVLAFAVKLSSVVFAQFQQLGHVSAGGHAKLRHQCVRVTVHVKGAELAQPQRAGGVDLLPAQAAGHVGHTAAGHTAPHAGVLAQRAAELGGKGFLAETGGLGGLGSGLVGGL